MSDADYENLWGEIVVEKAANGYKVYPYGEEGRNDTEYVYHSIESVKKHIKDFMGKPLHYRS